MKKKEKSDIDKILSLMGSLKNDTGLEERIKKIRKELNKSLKLRSNKIEAELNERIKNPEFVGEEEIFNN